MADTTAQRFTLAFGGNDQKALRELYAEDAYNPRIVLHDEFYDTTGTRGCFTFVFHWHNMDFPRDTRHPKPPIIEASVS